MFAAGKEIDCFECNSWDDPRCHDPFNFTAFANDMPKIVACEGCCVKLVRDRGKGTLLIIFKICQSSQTFVRLTRQFS